MSQGEGVKVLSCETCTAVRGRTRDDTRQRGGGGGGVSAFSVVNCGSVCQSDESVSQCECGVWRPCQGSSVESRSGECGARRVDVSVVDRVAHVVKEFVQHEIYFVLNLYLFCNLLPASGPGAAAGPPRPTRTHRFCQV